MSIKDCLISAAEQGAITRAEAQALADEFDDNFAQARLTMGDAPAISKAKADLEKKLRAEAIEKKRRADLTEAARLTLKTRLEQSESGVLKWATGLLSHYGFRDGSSVRGRAEAIMATAHARLSDVMFTFRRSGVLGRRINMALSGDLVRELHGEHGGDATAHALAQAVSEVFEDLRRRFNAAGGAIGRLEGWGLPHSHDRLKVQAAGLDRWKADMRERIDPARIIDSVTGQPISAQRLDAALNNAYANIVSDGMASLVPQMRPFGRGALAGRHAEHRFFVFRDAEAWLDYHRTYGKGDVMQAIFGHVNRMSKDIAAMEILGPNPGAMVEWVRQVVRREYGLADAGRASRAAPITGLSASQGAAAEAYVGWLWQTLRGHPTVVSGAAAFTGSVKNLTSSAILGATGLLSAVTDPVIARAGRRLAGLPQTSQLAGLVRMLSRQSREDVIRSGVMWDEYVHVMADELRFAGPMVGAEWTRWLADRAVTWNGLKPLTTGRKLVEARAWQAHVADLAREGVAFGRLDPRFRRALEGFGVTAEDWQIWSGAIDARGFVTPMSIIEAGGPVSYLDASHLPLADPARLTEERAIRHRAAAEKLAELTTSWGERSVPAGTPNARAVVSGGTARGTLLGELGDYFTQLKSFGLSFTALQMEALQEMAGRGGVGSRGTAMLYFARLAVPLTLGAAVYIQIRHLLDGRDPENMTDPAFWGKAIITGGGFGLFGDFLKATENRFGQSMLEALQGPGIAFLSDSFQLARGYAEAALQAEDANPGRSTRRYLQRWTPVVSSHPATRAAWNRLALDWMQYLTDPKAAKSFKSQASRAKANGSPYFLPPGTLTPAKGIQRRRGANVGAAIGR